LFVILSFSFPYDLSTKSSCTLNAYPSLRERKGVQFHALTKKKKKTYNTEEVEGMWGVDI
jgi:hypothetical protein